MAKGTVYHSLALDNGGSIDRVSVLVRLLVSNESKSPTAFSEGKVRLLIFSGGLEDVEDDGWRESSTSSAGSIVDVVAVGPSVTGSQLRCLPNVWAEDPPAVILF